MNSRQHHHSEVLSFLRATFNTQNWTLTLPPGTGNETYFAVSDKHDYFIKLGAQWASSARMADLGISPPIAATGYLADGTPVLVQQCIEGRAPNRADYREHLHAIATMLGTMHRDAPLLSILDPNPAQTYRDAALLALARLCLRWEQHRGAAPRHSHWIDAALNTLHAEAQSITGTGFVASHNDLCNANMLISGDGKIYILDPEMMARDDPACDLGAILWWYYPPHMHSHFIEVAGHTDNPGLHHRMRVRMAMHCLGIALPRVGSFDNWNPDAFEERVADFRAVLEGRENPSGNDE